MNTAIMNERDCLFEWSNRIYIGQADPNANVLGLIRAISSFYASPNQTGNALACWRALIVTGLSMGYDTQPMNELDCLRVIFAAIAGSTPNVSQMNELACLRGILDYV